MRRQEQTSDRPAAVTYEEGAAYTTVVLRIGVEEHEADGARWYTCEMSRLVLETAELTPELRSRIEGSPESFMDYVPRREMAAMQRRYTAAVQAWMDAEAATRGYDNIHTASSYENSGVERFRAEGVACREWRDAVWTACYAYLDAVLAGTEAIVPVGELIERLPQMAWPSVG